jgi:hypothetical protein
MNLKEIEKQVKELQKLNINNLSPEQLQEIVDKLFDITDEAETQLNNEIQTQINEPED